MQLEDMNHVEYGKHEFWYRWKTKQGLKVSVCGGDDADKSWQCGFQNGAKPCEYQYLCVNSHANNHVGTAISRKHVVSIGCT